jgi:hypothetical protein
VFLVLILFHASASYLGNNGMNYLVTFFFSVHITINFKKYLFLETFISVLEWHVKAKLGKMLKWSCILGII